MNFLLTSYALVVSGALLALLAASLLPGCNRKSSIALLNTSIFENIKPEEAADLIQKNLGNSSFVILDVRTPGEYNAGHIEGAVNSDYYSESFRNDLGRMGKNKIYLVYCRSGNRSGKTLEIMKELGFSHAYNMTGGINVWISKGFPTVR